ncbi:alpha/beta hydrolase [Myroides marinus]|uniref:Esterase n=1 Tax=Myroides marinus TaxID=703342 RepID=A0A161SM07_9FLAO|nr:alpha/beta hydrolase-fold protein [Myroides marinus]KZE83586.1 esterase [Myroides marinus]MDM1531781.1 alpha/beta hydrolase [Myroides marinus]MDM1538795.1 alpha/beta hydrolase [Myroides marinus]
MMNIRSLLLMTVLLLGFSGISQIKSKPLVLGTTEELHSTILNENRIINVVLPSDYNANDTVKYPVVYILDGGVEEDFIHLAGLVRFNSQPWIARFPNSIIVGIETINRRQDMTFAVPNLDFVEKAGFSKDMFPKYGRAEAYTAFLESELIPFIEKNYKADATRTVIGESLAGLYSTYVLMNHPYLFTNYIIISPSLWWGDGKLLDKTHTCLLEKIKQKVNVYVGLPSKEEDVMMYEQGKQLYDNLQKNKNIKSHFDYLPNEIHSTVIHQAVNNAFQKLYPTTYFSK